MPEIIDIGHVGEVASIDAEVVHMLVGGDFIPVIAPVGAGENGETYNINADTAAGALSAALAAEKFVVLTDVAGVIDKDDRLISTLSEDQAEKLIEQGIASGGMIPKIRCCLSALAGGVPKAHVIDGRVSHGLLLEILTEEGIGTEIVRERAPGA